MQILIYGRTNPDRAGSGPKIKYRKFLCFLCICLVLLPVLIALSGGCGTSGSTAAYVDHTTLHIQLGNGGIVILDPIYAERAEDQTVIMSLYENLMRLTQDESGKLQLEPGAAERVEQVSNEDGSVTYDFYLRNMLWSDGQRVLAEDFVYAWRRLADPAMQSPYGNLLSSVRGYRQAQASENMSLLEVKAKDDTVFSVTLEGRSAWFLTQVCTAPATIPLRQDVVARLKSNPNGWSSDPCQLVTNGAYHPESYDKNTGLTVTLTTRYRSFFASPEKLVFSWADDGQMAEKTNANTNIDINIDTDTTTRSITGGMNTQEQNNTENQTESPDIIQNFTWTIDDEDFAQKVENGDTATELAYTSVIFNCKSSIFEDRVIRQALSLALDRNAITEAAGEGALMAEGLIPPGVPAGLNSGSDFRELAGSVLENDPESVKKQRVKAKAMLSSAGYDSSEDLEPLICLYEESEQNRRVIQELCQQWQIVLDLDVIPVELTRLELWTALRDGTYDFALVTRSGFGNDAECFLLDWVTNAPNNISGYGNSAFDTLMAVVVAIDGEKNRLGCLRDAEELLLEHAALAPLYIPCTAWDLQEDYTGLYHDGRGWFRFDRITPAE